MDRDLSRWREQGHDCREDVSGAGPCETLGRWSGGALVRGHPFGERSRGVWIVGEDWTEGGADRMNLRAGDDGRRDISQLQKHSRGNDAGHEFRWCNDAEKRCRRKQGERERRECRQSVGKRHRNVVEAEIIRPVWQNSLQNRLLGTPPRHDAWNLKHGETAQENQQEHDVRRQRRIILATNIAHECGAPWHDQRRADRREQQRSRER